MTKEQATWLADTCDGEIRDDYSGRGMYGQTTHAVVTDMSLPEIICRLWSNTDDPEDSSFMNDIPCSPNSLRSDSMGLSTVLY